MTIENQDELKVRAQEAFDSLHWLMMEDFDAAYEMIDEHDTAQRTEIRSRWLSAAHRHQARRTQKSNAKLQ